MSRSCRFYCFLPFAQLVSLSCRLVTDFEHIPLEKGKIEYLALHRFWQNVGLQVNSCQEYSAPLTGLQSICPSIRPSVRVLYDISVKPSQTAMIYYSLCQTLLTVRSVHLNKPQLMSVDSRHFLLLSLLEQRKKIVLCLHCIPHLPQIL